jgi:hypothetical protein
MVEASTPSPNQRTVLDQLADTDTTNYTIAKRNLGSKYLLCEDVVQLYRAIGPSASLVDCPKTEGFAVAVCLCISCQHHLVTSCLSCMQGRITDSYIQSRRALEACAIAKICAADQEAALLWLSTTMKQRAPLRKRFSKANMFPVGDELLAHLGELFDFCSAVTHASLHSICAGFVRNKSQDKRIELAHCEILHPADLLTTFLWTVDTHMRILRVFETILRPYIEQTWRTEFDHAAERIERHKAEHAPTLKASVEWRRQEFGQNSDSV